MTTPVQPPAHEDPAPIGPHEHEPHSESLATRLNALRAGVLGANDGIVSTAGLVMGVAAATTDRQTILIAGIAGLVAGALSMAAGEYVSVSTQRDTERALIAKETRELETSMLIAIECMAGTPEVGLAKLELNAILEESGPQPILTLPAVCTADRL